MEGSIVVNTYESDEHPWKMFIPANATKLFIGTFPTEKRNRRYEFFYSSGRNRFWETLKNVESVKQVDFTGLDEVEVGKKILKHLGLGLTDMGQKVLRQTGSSNDHSLFPIEFMDILSIVQEYPKIDAIYVSGDVSGNSSLSWLGIYLGLNQIQFNVKKVKDDNQGDFVFEGRKIIVFRTYSPSRQARGISDDKLLEEYTKHFEIK